MPLISADYIYTPDGLQTGLILEIQSDGTVLQCTDLPPGQPVEIYEGILCPGFVNAHCHVELSFLKGQIDEATGMPGFVSQLYQKRQGFTESEMEVAISEALVKLWNDGTVAVGDICNTSLSAGPKRENPNLFTHSFIELLGLNASRAADIFEQGKITAAAFEELPHSLTAHAPYSMSAPLLEKIYASGSDLLSIHLLESKEERQIFETGDGPFLPFFEQLGIQFEKFPTPSPLPYILNQLSENQQVLFVHNTEMTTEELESIVEAFPHAYFCLCPRSNHFIHRTFPDVNLFTTYRDRICLGTDSLASNYSLDVFDEVKAIHTHDPGIPLHTLLNWATTGGARALNQSDKFGIFAPGTKPGINLISSIDLQHLRLTHNSTVRKLW